MPDNTRYIGNMMKIVVPHPSLPIISKSIQNGSARFDVNRIYCIARNYREHAIEMGHDPDRDHPFFFQKPANAIVDTAASTRNVIPYPPMTSSLHHEGELVVAIGKQGLYIKEEDAFDHVFGYAVGCDLTRRDLQAEAKKMGRPWATAKGFDFSAPIGAIVPKDEEGLEDLLSSSSGTTSSNISLRVNDDVRQDSSLDNMIWNVPEIIAHLSKYFRLRPGDLVMTGTPAGVNALNVGDSVSISCGNLPSCEFVIGEAETS